MWNETTSALYYSQFCIYPATGCNINSFKENPKEAKHKKLTAVQRRLGEYWRSREARSIASAGILLWKIWERESRAFH
jgi:hypothetical protein